MPDLTIDLLTAVTALGGTEPLPSIQGGADVKITVAQIAQYIRDNLMPSPLPVISQVGIGALAAVPAGSTNGTLLATLPSNAQGVRFYLPLGSAVTFTVATTAPSTAPTYTYTISPATTGPVWDENLFGSNIYVTSIVGAPLFRIY